MTAHSHLVVPYRRTREIRFRFNNLLALAIPQPVLRECGRKLGIFRKETFVFGSEDEVSILMDYGIYHPQSDGRNMVARYLEETPTPAGSDEIAVLQAMTHAYYSVFQVTDVERGVGISVVDLLRDEPGFFVDVGLGNTANRHMMIASRAIPEDGFLATGGAGLPLDASAARRVFDELTRTRQTPDHIDFHKITPRRESEIAALIIRTGLSEGMSSRVAYAEPGSPGRPAPGGPAGRSDRRNVLCPCGSGKKYRSCCGRR
jgi:SEC-C motif